MRFAWIRENFQGLPAFTELWNQDFSIQAVDRVLITLDNQDRAVNSGDLVTRQLLRVRCVVLVRIGGDWIAVRWRVPLPLLWELLVQHAQKPHARWFFWHDHGQVGLGCE